MTESSGGCYAKACATRELDDGISLRNIIPGCQAQRTNLNGGDSGHACVKRSSAPVRYLLQPTTTETWTDQTLPTETMESNE